MFEIFFELLINLIFPNSRSSPIPKLSKRVSPPSSQEIDDEISMDEKQRVCKMSNVKLF